MVTIRRADPSDSRTLWEWRNDPDARAASLDTLPVPLEDHDRWFAASVANPARLILIAVDDEGSRLGMVRFDFDDAETATVSINVAPERRGSGIGQRVLHAAIDRLREEQPGRALTAHIRATNVASTRVFERAGFTRVSESGGVVTLRAL